MVQAGRPCRVQADAFGFGSASRPLAVVRASIGRVSTQTLTRIDPAYTTPIYSQTEVAKIIVAPKATVSNWATGYLSASGAKQRPVLSGVVSGRGITVPFVGLAEAYVLTAFRKAGLPLQRIRPAVAALKETIGLEYALASARLMTDGVEVLLKSDDPADRRLVVVRHGQAVFSEVVEDYLRFVDFGDEGMVSSIRLPRFDRQSVSVTPTINGGQPTVTSRGVLVSSILGRLRAGESPEDVGDDFGISADEVLYLNRAES